jgi:hypothetical protein
MEWADDLDTIFTPDQLTPTRMRDFPLAMETSERLKRICKLRADELKQEALTIEDQIIDRIEVEEIVVKINGGGQPVTKKKFATAEKQKRELRRRLAERDDYAEIQNDRFQWEMMYSDWVSHVNRLRRELRLLEERYNATGDSNYPREETSWEKEKDARRTTTHKNRIGRAFN